MGKKLTYEYVKSKFEEQGYSLLETSYSGSKTKMLCMCDKGHQYLTTWFNWYVNSSRCPVCNGGVSVGKESVSTSLNKEGYTLISTYKNYKSTITVKCPDGHVYNTTYQSWKRGARCGICKVTAHRDNKLKVIKSTMEKEGYTLLSTEYEGYNSHVDFICNKGHTNSILVHSWDRGHRCSICTRNKKLTYEFVKEQFEKEGYILLSKEYKGSKTKLEYICPKGHQHSVTWDNWKHGKRCPKCRQINIDVVRLEFEEEGYTVLSNNYQNNHTKLDYICPNGHKHSISLNDWRSGHRCAVCAGLAKPTIISIAGQFKQEGYTLLSTEYTNCHTKLDYLCSSGHLHTTTWSTWQKGGRCPTCAHINKFGSGNPSWQGGKSFEPYCPIWKDQEYKSDIRERDGNRCLNPYCYGNDNVLSIHHIDYDKKNCHPSNLITVCRSCNSRANTNRTWHKSWYKAIMYRRHGVKGVKL